VTQSDPEMSDEAVHDLLQSKSLWVERRLRPNLVDNLLGVVGSGLVTDPGPIAPPLESQT
jgi:hypothetical protein